jgi:hypothetical protein
MKIYVPQHSSLISVEKYFRVANATDDLEKVAEITGKKIADIKHMSLETIDEILAMFESAMKKPVGKFQRVIKIKTGFFSSVRLGFIPDLNTMSYYEYVTIDQFAREYVQGNNDKLIDLVAAMFRPVTWRVGNRYKIRNYDSTNTTDYIRAIELMKMDQVLNAVFFFSRIREELHKSSDEFLSTTLSQQMKKIESLTG